MCLYKHFKAKTIFYKEATHCAINKKIAKLPMNWYCANQVKNKSKSLNQQNKILFSNIHPINTQSNKRGERLYAYVCAPLYKCMHTYQI